MKNHTCSHTGRENVEYTFAADSNATRRNSIFVMFVVLPALVALAAHLVGLF